MLPALSCTDGLGPGQRDRTGTKMVCMHAGLTRHSTSGDPSLTRLAGKQKSSSRLVGPHRASSLPPPGVRGPQRVRTVMADARIRAVSSSLSSPIRALRPAAPQWAGYVPGLSTVGAVKTDRRSDETRHRPGDGAHHLNRSYTLFRKTAVRLTEYQRIFTCCGQNSIEPVASGLFSQGDATSTSRLLFMDWRQQGRCSNRSRPPLTRLTCSSGGFPSSHANVEPLSAGPLANGRTWPLRLCCSF